MQNKNPQRMKSSHEKFPVRARRDAAHSYRASIVSWRYNPVTTVVDGVVCVVPPQPKLVKGIPNGR